jgi:choline dehydrogenase-like flavoprotein
MKDEYRQRRQRKHAAARRKIKLSPETAALFESVMRTQGQVFREKFGREMGPDDPIFFDENADTPQPMSKESHIRILVEACEAAGIPPRLIYAVKKTGLIMGEGNQHLFSEEQRRAWDAAVAEYDKLQ